MAPEEYIALVDELAGTTVEAIAFCLGEGRTMLHDSRASELMGHNVAVTPVRSRTLQTIDSFLTPKRIL